MSVVTDLAPLDAITAKVFVYEPQPMANKILLADTGKFIVSEGRSGND
ncbi:MAG: hypothetical protein OXE74_06020 [Cyanobacteria bacterium MAG CAR2_bin_4]|nr:hypothetical protein [Cyanobacteria bacterium MAG CAR2_bin_4]